MVEINPQQPPDQFTNAPPAPDPKTLGELLSQGAKDSGLLGRLWNLFWHGVNDGVVLVVTGVARTIDQLMIWVGDFFRVAQGEKNPEFWVLVATITEDLTGVPVDAEELKKAYFGSGRLAAMGVTGGSLLDLLGMEFIAKSGAGSKGDVKRGTGIGGLQTGTITPEQGVEAPWRSCRSSRWATGRHPLPPPRKAADPASLSGS